ncbi:MAG: carboxypeptidase-like regulatory domain-containing protein [Sulfuricaulis sp.]|uniref:carboxypeptidase-like regulatory domain-containing protein n=1 Tax=Sulfuricaulis sp. TaxID=2003553 RepID=UPI0034A38199
MMSYRIAVLFLACLLAPSVHAASDSFKEGSVLQDGTDTAIAGAVVVVRWQDRSLGRQTGCLHTESAVTDAQGRYRVPAWQTPSEIPGPGAEPVVTVYKQGFQQSRMHGRNRDTQYLKPSVQERKARLDYLLRINHIIECHAAGDSRKNLLPLKQALYQEALEMAVTEEDKKTVDELQASIEATAK